MKKAIRITIGAVLSAVGIVFAILPGSILFLISGLMLLSYDIPLARKCLQKCQNSMSVTARRLDRYLLNRKYR
ncbi:MULTISPECIES: tellurium resistance protein TerC [Aliiglaciecola]|uniref:tellurium resistance protein TerC n=1 Tax=Aliiglaciecola TaxID=1406885 RepID=UPI001C099650|nr:MULTISPECIES: tellurium resistance protein TerC [Aliiglaciecola]MBU2878271.1 tellurium resistance protein TerC [Aliiglaciecola lipolytica]MDO6711817.1 tellurium resistance protein TerC [Aliiglaciecola sp. 2_MG-2023]MDO6753009.1 tellurium resistance protein TerC [Aliiglaciecola sp. 1_MG-2023]